MLTIDPIAIDVPAIWQSDNGQLPQGTWYVLHTRSRQEKALADDLGRMRIPHLLPLRQEVRYYGKRKAVVEAPLFPGYIFLCGDLEQAYAADRTRRVANVLRVKDQVRIRWELENLNRALAANAAMPLDPFPYLKVGIRVEVRSGPFRGLQGLIADRRSTDRLLLQVDMLGQAVSLELDGALLDAMN